MRSTSIRGASDSERRECESVDAIFRSFNLKMHCGFRNLVRSPARWPGSPARRCSAVCLAVQLRGPTSLRDPDQNLGVKDRRIHGSRTRILVARCARSSNARASHFSSLAIARSSKCDKISGLLLFGSRKQGWLPGLGALGLRRGRRTCFRDPNSITDRRVYRISRSER